MTKMIKSLLAIAASFSFATAAIADESHETPHPEKQEWHWQGVFGSFDRQQLQRGYQVYKEVCAACHAMHLMSFRNLSQPGGPEFSEAQMKAIAAGFQVPTLNDAGETVQRAGTSADRFPSPFPNEKAARAANGNAYPPDLSVIAKAREGGPDYIYALLTGYKDPPPDFTLLPGLNYNEYFPGHQIAMPAPLTSDGQVTYAPDQGNPPATKQQMAKDVVAFLAWASEPHLEARKTLGVKVMLFLGALSLLLFFAYRRIWKDVEH